ncbi:MAG: hypothetical protein HUU37_10155 [Bdellovibrionales bacterium]|nr:hypothetical protein [Bdellovibrionales bacterium]
MPPVTPPAAKSAESHPSPDNPSPAVTKFITQEARRLSGIDPDPEATRRRLNAWAREVDARGSQDLGAVVLDEDRDQDERFLAAFLLGLVPDDHAVEVLRKVALEPFHGRPMGEKHGDRLRAIEVQVRAAAIEGLARHRQSVEARTALETAAKAHEDQFLSDRAQRALHEWRTGERVEEQDRKALGKALTR